MNYQKELRKLCTKKELLKQLEEADKNRAKDVGWGAFMAPLLAIFLVKIWLTTTLGPGLILLLTLFSAVFATVLLHKVIFETLNWLTEGMFKRAYEEHKKLSDALQKELDDTEGE